MPVFANSGLNLHYLERGVGEPVLLIHGLGSSGADWAFQMPALEGGFRVIVPDLPGSGYSDPPHDAYGIEGFAGALWALLDELDAPRANIIGFSLGGAVALEMALQRPASVPRLALINSLATYRIDHWRKWLEARVPIALVRVLGMRRTARLTAARVFPEPWQSQMRARTVDVLGAVPPAAYLGMGRALERWTATERLSQLSSRILMIAAEHDYTPLAEKRALAVRLGASLVVVRGSRHGTPFDATHVTNECLVALLNDLPLPPAESWSRDERVDRPLWPFVGSLAEEHAASRQAA
jgi:pimeloyl-ACP methyl ester carboxylesterase